MPPTTAFLTVIIRLKYPQIIFIINEKIMQGFPPKYLSFLAFGDVVTSELLI